MPLLNTFVGTLNAGSLHVFHIPAAPAEVLMVLTLGNPTPACPGTNSVEIIDATVALLDVA